MYRIIEPEVAGGLGEATIMNKNVHPPVIEKLNYEFNGWLGDDLLESFPCFIMSERLKNMVESEGLTGVRFDGLIVTKSEEFNRSQRSIELPKFYWAKINGRLGFNDLAIGDDFRLIISERAYEVLTLFNLSHALIEEI